MLNKVVLMQQLQAVSQDLFKDFSDEFAIARDAWQRIVDDPTFIYKLRQITIPWLVPDWSEPIGSVIPVDPELHSYVVLAVDGSQVYPDRHQGTSCFLVNIGVVVLQYGATPGKPVQFESRPYVFGAEVSEDERISLNTEVVNCRRQELEFQLGLEYGMSIRAQYSSHIPFAFLFDGSFIFWHLESQEAALKELFLSKYLSLLDQFYDAAIACAGYISMPKSKELVNVLRVQLCNFNLEEGKETHAVDHVVDAHVASFFLSPASRSIVFKSNAKITAFYPEHLKPYFFYLHVGQELVRIEVPAWVAQDDKKVDEIARIILNQAVKGRGYPIALAEAHEQAVIKGPDREFFYQLLTKLAMERRQYYALSQKSIKKRGMGI